MKLDKVDVKGRTLHVSGVDVVDGTFIIDIKPYHPLDGGPLIRQDDDILVGGAAKKSSEMDIVDGDGETHSTKRRKIDATRAD